VLSECWIAARVRTTATPELVEPCARHSIELVVAAVDPITAGT
jgi:hypothetical protein